MSITITTIAGFWLGVLLSAIATRIQTARAHTSRVRKLSAWNRGHKGSC